MRHRTAGRAPGRRVSSGLAGAAETAYTDTTWAPQPGGNPGAARNERTDA